MWMSSDHNQAQKEHKPTDSRRLEWDAERKGERKRRGKIPRTSARFYRKNKERKLDRFACALVSRLDTMSERESTQKKKSRQSRPDSKANRRAHISDVLWNEMLKWLWEETKTFSEWFERSLNLMLMTSIIFEEVLWVRRSKRHLSMDKTSLPRTTAWNIFLTRSRSSTYAKDAFQPKEFSLYHFSTLSTNAELCFSRSHKQIMLSSARLQPMFSRPNQQWKTKPNRQITISQIPFVKNAKKLVLVIRIEWKCWKRSICKLQCSQTSCEIRI